MHPSKKQTLTLSTTGQNETEVTLVLSHSFNSLRLLAKQRLKSQIEQQNVYVKNNNIQYVQNEKDAHITNRLYFTKSTYGQKLLQKSLID